MAFVDINSIQSWTYSNTLGGINRIETSTDLKWIKNTFTNNYNYKQDRNYQYITSVTGSGTVGQLSIKFRQPFQDGIITTNENIQADGGVEYYTYANPINTQLSDTLLLYGAYESFTNSVIQSTKLHELKFLVNGFSEYKLISQNQEVQPSGWSYNLSTNGLDYSYDWFLSYTNSSISPSYSTFGSGLNTISNKNYIAKLIEYDTFNLELDYAKHSGDSDDVINVYLVKNGQLNLQNSWTPVLSLTGSVSLTGTQSVIGLAGTNVDGTKNYLLFTFDNKPAVPGLNRVNSFHASLSNINTYGSYHPINNRLVIVTDDDSISPTASIVVYKDTSGRVIESATYSYSSLSNGQPYTLRSKIGNGFFKAGIWENGVWNNGWRNDTESRDFDDVALSILTSSDVSWKIEIRGSTQSIQNFATGSVISIGNIVAIDINDNRKLLKDYYKIEAVGTEANYGWLRVNLDTTFPYRRIEKDSPNHKIKVTKNIWLSGGFFNGYFSGVWNNGLFKGYPLITEMFDTHWVDGFFNGGHINSNYSYTWNFRALGTREACSNGFIDLTFFEKTSFLTGDYINISLREEVTQSASASFASIYNGVAQIVDIKTLYDYNQIYDVITINKFSLGKPTIGSTMSTSEDNYRWRIGSAIRYTATSVIQNFKFYDNNRSKLKSSDSNISSAVFSFNSWVDVNYDPTRSVTLGRDFRAYEPLTGKSINRNNLFGYPTYDVLSSATRFRDSNTLNSKLYKLGTKYKVFSNFIGEFSQFNEPFDPALDNIVNFYNAGWTFSYRNSNINFNRTESLISSSSATNTLAQSYIDSGVTGDELYITSVNSGGILNNNNILLNKSRYSVVEFDVITYSVANTEYTYGNESYTINESGYNGATSPPFTQSTSTIAGSLTASRIFALDNDTLIEGSVDFANGFDGPVYNIDRQSDGSFIISGSFSTYDGATLPMHRVCRLDSAGILDTAFPSASVITEIGTPSYIKPYVIKNVALLSDRVFLLCYYASGVLLHTKNVSGRILRLDASGDLDTSWTNYNMGFNGIVNDIAVRPDGTTSAGVAIIVGAFTRYWYFTSSVQTYAANKLLAFNVNGTINSSSLYVFGDTNDTRAFTISTDIPTTIAICNNNTVLIGGKITRFKTNAGNLYYINGIVQLNTLAGIFTVHINLVSGNSLTATTRGFVGVTNPPLIPGVYSPNFINKIIVDSTDRIYVIGQFTSYIDTAPHGTFNIVRLTSSGYFDNSFVTGQGLNNSGFDITLKPDGTILYAAGLFTSYNNINCGKVVALKTINGSLDATTSTLDPTGCVVRALEYTTNDLIIGGDFTVYQQGQSSVVDQVLLTSSYIESNQILSTDILNISLSVSLTCSDLSKITINLKSPDNKVINIKKPSSGTGTTLIDTIFDFSNTSAMSTSVQPYSGIFRMDRQLSLGTSGYVSDVVNIADMVTSDTSGSWVIYIQDDGAGTVTLHDWYILIRYRDYIDDVADAPVVDLPVLHFSNLNYEINTQPTIGATGSLALQIYKKMSYLPITQNVNHLTSTNTFRLDSIESATPDRWGGFGTNQKTKKYEYFYNKTDMMMNLSGNGEGGGSQSMVIMDNLNMYEVDMIPFFKYFDEANIYKGIQQPIRGTSPEIDYLNSDFIFIDNISIGLDSIEADAIDTTFIGCGAITLDDLITNVKITGITLSHTQSSYQMINATYDNQPGSSTCSTIFNSISWIVISPFGAASILNANTLYPTIIGLTAGLFYNVSVEVYNGAQTSVSTMVINVDPVPYIPPPTVSITTPVSKAISFIPGESGTDRAKALLYADLVVSYFNSSVLPADPAPVSIEILSLPTQGDLTLNNILLSVNSIVPLNTIDPNYTTGTIVGNLDFYPEGLTQVVNNSAFNASFTYAVLDAQGVQSTIGTMNLVCTIPVAIVTVTTPKTKLFDYNTQAPTLSNFAFDEIDITDGYINSNGINAASITILTLPSRGQLASSGGAVTIGQVISIANIITNNFTYHVQNINMSDNTGGDFVATFTYKVFDLQANDSNVVTMNIDCVDLTPAITNLAPRLVYLGNEYTSVSVGNTASVFTLSGSGPWNLSIKNQSASQDLLFGTSYFPATGGTSSMIHLFGNTTTRPNISVSPHNNDQIGPLTSSTLTFNRASVPNGKYVVTVTTQIPYLSGYISGAYIWYITLA